MSEKGKVWVIDPTRKKRQKVNGRAIQEEFGQPAAQQTDPSRQKHASQARQPAMHAGHAASQARDNRTNASRSGTGTRERLYRNLSYRRDTAPFLLLAYLFGPFAICATREGRKSRFWLSAGIGSGIATVILPVPPRRETVLVTESLTSVTWCILSTISSEEEIRHPVGKKRTVREQGSGRIVGSGLWHVDSEGYWSGHNSLAEKERRRIFLMYS